MALPGEPETWTKIRDVLANAPRTGTHLISWNTGGSRRTKGLQTWLLKTGWHATLRQLIGISRDLRFELDDMELAVLKAIGGLSWRPARISEPPGGVQPNPIRSTPTQSNPNPIQSRSASNPNPIQSKSRSNFGPQVQTSRFGLDTWGSWGSWGHLGVLGTLGGLGGLGGKFWPPAQALPCGPTVACAEAKKIQDMLSAWRRIVRLKYYIPGELKRLLSGGPPIEKKETEAEKRAREITESNAKAEKIWNDSDDDLCSFLQSCDKTPQRGEGPKESKPRPHFFLSRREGGFTAAGGGPQRHLPSLPHGVGGYTRRS